MPQTEWRGKGIAIAEERGNETVKSREAVQSTKQKLTKVASNVRVWPLASQQQTLTIQCWNWPVFPSCHLSRQPSMTDLSVFLQHSSSSTVCKIHSSLFPSTLSFYPLLFMFSSFPVWFFFSPIFSLTRTDWKDRDWHIYLCPNTEKIILF